MPRSERSNVPEPEPSRIEFPGALHAEDESVNAFVERALATLSAGDYDAYRLLWASHVSPSDRNDFENRWHGVRVARVRACQKIALTDADGRPAVADAYALLADVQFDPAQPPLNREPVRGIVWLIEKRAGEWRLARPPDAVTEWMRAKAPDSASTPNATRFDSSDGSP